MLTDICPKLPMHNKAIIRNYYVNMLGFNYIGNDDYYFYFIIKKR